MGLRIASPFSGLSKKLLYRKRQEHSSNNLQTTKLQTYAGGIPPICSPFCSILTKNKAYPFLEIGFVGSVNARAQREHFFIYL